MKICHIQKVGNAVVGCLIFLLCLATNNNSWGKEPLSPPLKSETPQKLTLVIGKSTVIQTPGMIKRVSLAAPEIAEAIVLDPRQIYLIGKSPGLTNLTLWKNDNTISEVMDIEVVPNLTLLKEKIHTILPEETNIRISSAGGSITLSGTVSSAAAQSKILALVEPYAPTDKDKKKIINLLEVAGVQQVMLEVTISEMSRQVLKRMGINFNVMNASGEFGLSLLNNLTNVSTLANLSANPTSMYPAWNPYGASAPTMATPYIYPSSTFPSGVPATAAGVPTGATSGGGWPVTGTGISSNVTGVLRFFVNGVPWTVLIDALKQNGVVKVLAEPTLITISGQQANFLAGGEVPIPVPGGLGTVAIQYKPYGVGLSFTPTVLGDGKISMTVTPEVSDIDSSNAVAVLGTFVPAFNVRRVSTTIELGDGQSFAIAGLLNENIREVVSKFPILGDLPIIGTLFRSSEFQKRESELIVIVTPHLVKPLDKTKQPLPTDQFIEPNDFDFYLMGRLEGKSVSPDEPRVSKAPAPVAKPKEEKGEGNFGHILPKN
jgi:pilus assembly protein CpaC